MDYNEKNRPRCLADCRVDWEHYPISGGNGSVTLEDCSHLRNDWLEDECACDANSLADTVKCDRYYAFDYDYNKLRLYHQIPSYEGTPFDIWGLQKMFNDNWLQTPAFIKWIGKNSFGYLVYEAWLETFLNGIHDPRMRLEILKFIIKHADYIIPDTKKEEMFRLRNTYDRYEAAYQLEKKKNAEKRPKKVVARNTYHNCTFNNCSQTENNNYYGVPPSAQPQVEPVSAASNDAPPMYTVFKHITQKCMDEKRVEAVEAEIRAACKGTAEGLWRTLWDNENLGYVSVEHLDATTLYKDIETRFGELPFKERQFRSARNKRYL